MYLQNFATVAQDSTRVKTNLFTNNLEGGILLLSTKNRLSSKKLGIKEMYLNIIMVIHETTIANIY
jgi:hypothetical protein